MKYKKTFSGSFLFIFTSEDEFRDPADIYLSSCNDIFFVPIRATSLKSINDCYFMSTSKKLDAGVVYIVIYQFRTFPTVFKTVADIS